MNKFISDFLEFQKYIAKTFLQYINVNQIETLHPEGPSLSYIFMPEIVGLIAIIYILAIVLLNMKYICEAFMKYIFFVLIFTCFVMILSIIYSELDWYFCDVLKNFAFYPNYRLRGGSLFAFCKILTLVLTIASIILHKSYFVKSNKAWEYSIIIMILTISNLLLISSNDFFFAFLALELQTLGLFVFVALQSATSLKAEASTKFFIYSSFSSVCFAYGISLIYILFGTTQFNSISIMLANWLSESNQFMVYTFYFAVILVLSSLLFKLTVAPFHFWVGDIFQGSDGYVGSYLAIVSKLPVWILLAKILYLCLLPTFHIFALILKLLAVLSIAVSCYSAFMEPNFKRFWAWSSIGHSGYILLALTSTNGFSSLGFIIAIFYLVLYLTATVYVWAFFMHMNPIVSSDYTVQEFLLDLSRFTSLKSNKLLLSFNLSLMILSLAGLPPAMGALPKLMLFYLMYQQFDLFLLAIVFFLNLVSLAYYLRFVRLLSFGATPNGSDNVQTYENLTKDVAAVTVFCWILHSLFFLLFLNIIIIIPFII